MFSTSIASSFSKPILLRATGSNFDAPISSLRELYLLLTLKNLWRRIGQYLIRIYPVPRKNLVVILTALFRLERLKKLQGFWFPLVPKNLYVGRLVGSCPYKFLLIVHDSLLLLAGIKDKNDLVKFWQGEIIYVPKKWAPLDVVFLYFLPALPFKLDEILGSLTKNCSPQRSVAHSYNVTEFVDEPGLYLAVLIRSEA
ncbi:hypothetical protein K1719_027390 [Acacia pycnantha]|nr:hypothetical protein K1719_027390 [Acacia pycnantha]